MEHSIGKTIAELRKEKGWTQVELAEKLNVSDKAISKWESEGGIPDVCQFPILAEIFNVSIDFLMTGRIDYLSPEARVSYCIKKDVVSYFSGYDTSDIVLHNIINYSRTTENYKTKILNAIYENHSKKIFAKFLNDSLKNKNNILQGLYDSCNQICCRASETVCGNLDDYIKMCCEANCLEGLEFINVKYFMIGEITKKERNYYTISDTYTSGIERYFTYTLGIDTLKYALNPKTSSEAIIDYFCDIELFNENGNRVYFMVDEVVSQLCENKDYKRINKILEMLNENNQYASKIYAESTRGSWYTGKGIARNGIYFTNNGMSYLRAYIYPLVKSVEIALQKNDYQLAKDLNKYNKELKGLFYGLDIKVYSEKELKLIELKSNKETPVEELYTIENLKNKKIDNYISSLESEIGELTHKNQIRKKYEEITQKLNKEYLIEELNKGESDKVVVLICKRLQILLQYKYCYEGDLFTMIDTLIDKTMRLHECHDDEDNNYRRYLEEDELFTERTNLLHKLRMKRNNIVHAELKEVNMTNDEIVDCINLIETLSK